MVGSMAITSVCQMDRFNEAATYRSRKWDEVRAKAAERALLGF